MLFRSTFEWDAERLANFSNLADNRVRGKVMFQAVKVGSSAAGMLASKLVRQRFMKVKSGEVKKNIRVNNWRGQKEAPYSTVTVDMSARWPMKLFQSGKFNPARPPMKGARFRMIKGKGRFTIPGAFIATINGRDGAWKRKGKDRFPVRHLYTKAPMRYLARKENADRILNVGYEKMSKEFDRYSKYVLSGGRGGVR